MIRRDIEGAQGGDEVLEHLVTDIQWNVDRNIGGKREIKAFPKGIEFHWEHALNHIETVGSKGPVFRRSMVNVIDANREKGFTLPQQGTGFSDPI